MLRSRRLKSIGIWPIAILIVTTLGRCQGSGTEEFTRKGTSWYSEYVQGKSEYEADRTAEAIVTLERAKADALKANVGELDEANILDSLGAAYEAEGKLENARTAFDEGLAARRRRLPETSEEIAISLTNESSVYWAMSKPEDTIRYAKEAKLIWEQLGKTDRKEYAVAVSDLLAGYRMQGRIVEAMPLARAAGEIYRRTLSGSEPLLPQSLGSLAALYKTAGDYRSADQLLAEALRLPATGSSTQTALRADLLVNVGDLKLAEGQLDQAEATVIEALNLNVGVSDLHVIQRAAAYRNLGQIHRQQGRLQQAQKDFEEALKLLEGRKGLADAERGLLFNQIGMLAVDRKQPKEAEQMFRRAVAELERLFGPDHPNVVSAHSNLACLYISQHHFGKAKEILSSLYEADKAVLPSNHPDIARDLNNLGSLEFKQRHYSEAEAEFREATSIFEKVFGEQHPTTGTTRGNLADTLSHLNRPEEAREQYLRAIDSLSAAWGPDNPKLIGLLASYANFSRLNENAAIAEQLETRMERIRVRQAVLSERESSKVN